MDRDGAAAGFAVHERDIPRARIDVPDVAAALIPQRVSIVAGGASTEIARVSTGIAALNQILSGGLFPGRTYLVVGPSGTGKTTLALAFLADGIRKGETVLLVTLEEPPNEIRANHHGLQPELDRIHVFDAIPDVMRYERTPFKDIAAVRSSIPFAQVPDTIRKTPELSSVEVTFTALEQTLKMEMARRNYTRLVIDSLTALQYFCMKGFDETIGAQTFLRFLSDLRVTTLLTVEAPLEDAESPERLLARGEMRLFRWEHEGRTVRAIGVEKFRGSPHDIRLHPYRIGPAGIDINLATTISRDTHLEVGGAAATEAVILAHAEADEAGHRIELAAPGLAGDIHDLAALGYDLSAIRGLLEESRRALAARRHEETKELLGRVSSRIREAVVATADGPPPPPDLPLGETWHRLLSRAEASRTGIPPIPPEADRLRLLYAALWAAAGTPAAVAPAGRALPGGSPSGPAPAATTRARAGTPEAPSTAPRAAAPPGPPPLPHPTSAIPSILPRPESPGRPERQPGELPSRGVPAAEPSAPQANVGPKGAPRATPGPKRRRKSTAASSRRRPAASAVTATAVEPGSAPLLPDTPVAPPVPIAGSSGLLAPKPKRRAPRKRKAPPVTSAEPGSPPPSPPPPPPEPANAGSESAREAGS